MKQTCILVLGMHRSGTSVLTGMLSMMDVYLGDELLNPDKNNEKGYFENYWINKINNNMLEKIGSSWDDIFFTEKKLEFLSENDEEELKELLSKIFSGKKYFAIKDPRIIYLFPIYEKVLSELNINIRIIIPHRSALEVALSLRKREGWSLEKGIILWVINFLLAELHSRKYTRVFLSYESIIEKEPSMIDHLITTLGIDTVISDEALSEIYQFIEPNLRHNYASNQYAKYNARFLKKYMDLRYCLDGDIKSNFDEKRTEFFDYIKVFLKASCADNFAFISKVLTLNEKYNTSHDDGSLHEDLGDLNNQINILSEYINSLGIMHRNLIGFLEDKNKKIEALIATNKTLQLSLVKKKLDAQPTHNRK